MYVSHHLVHGSQGMHLSYKRTIGWFLEYINDPATECHEIYVHQTVPFYDYVQVVGDYFLESIILVIEATSASDLGVKSSGWMKGGC